jgi:predicted amidohydrolase YtcJ
MPSYLVFAALALVILVNAAPPAPAAPAERVFRGGPIVTVDPARPAAEAIAIGGGTILAVGAEAEVMKLAGPETVVTELAGRTLLPGFVDGHSHFFSVVSVQTSALCASPPAGPCTSVADVIEPRPWN